MKPISPRAIRVHLNRSSCHPSPATARTPTSGRTRSRVAARGAHEPMSVAAEPRWPPGRALGPVPDGTAAQWALIRQCPYPYPVNAHPLSGKPVPLSWKARSLILESRTPHPVSAYPCARSLRGMRRTRTAGPSAPARSRRRRGHRARRSRRRRGHRARRSRRRRGSRSVPAQMFRPLQIKQSPAPMRRVSQSQALLRVRRV